MNTMQATHERITVNEQVTETNEHSAARICFGALMAVATLYGLWSAASLLISYLAG